MVKVTMTRTRSDVGKISIARVAQVAGVSKGTVSKVLSGSYRVSEKTRRKVLDAVRKLGYTPNVLARYISTGRSNLIVFMIKKEFGYPGEPFYTRILLNFEMFASRDDFWVLFKSFDGRNWKRVFKVAFSTGDAMVLVGKVNVSFANFLRRASNPGKMLLVDYMVKDSEIPYVMPDNVGGGRLVAQYFLEKGVKRGYFLCGDFSHPGIVERFEGFKKTMEENGGEVSLIRIKSTTNSFEDGLRLAQLFDKDDLAKDDLEGIGIMAANDAVAAGFVKGMGGKIEQMGGVAGFDDVFYSRNSSPAITTVKVDLNLFAEVAYSLVKKIMEHEEVPLENRIPVRLVVRET